MNVCCACNQVVDDLGKHYGSDECKKLVAVFGSVKASSVEYAHTGGRLRKVKCDCGKSAVKDGRCMPHWKEFYSTVRMNYMEKHGEEDRERRRKRYAKSKAKA